MNASNSGHPMALQLPDAVGPVALICAGVVLIVLALMAALGPGRPSGTTPVAAATANRHLDAWVFLAILVFAVALIAFGTSTTRMTGVGTLVVAIAGAWFRRGRSAEAGAKRTDTGSFSAKMLGIEYTRTWESEAPNRTDDNVV
ncbi:hypothetical protein [Streptomyces sp. NBC_01235]|uniref:hypothetical protein n=1 Tax=Streptomyces sp. NBC_01235 TaxID=2903788 RepID=UPI002E0EBA16|nr:hypothetical protein OG289_13150 [Streptomyces sp. NBC_01235]